MSAQSTKKTSVLSRYKWLMIATLLFLLAISALMGLSANYAGEVNKNRQRSMTANSLSPNTNAISRNLYRLDALAATQAPLSEQMAVINETTALNKMVNNALTALNEGGEFTTAAGAKVNVTLSPNPKVLKNLQAVLPEWQQVHGELSTFLTQSHDALQLSGSITPDSRKLQTLLKEMDKKFSLADNSIRQHTQQTLGKSQLISLIGIGVVLVYLSIFLWYFLRKLRIADETILIMQEETSHIMRTVREGLFLVDENLSISSQYSHELEKIIGQKELNSQNLNNVLRKLLPEEEVETTEEFIEQLFNDRVNEKLIADLNPLQKIKVNVDDFSGFYTTRYLDFHFSRVYQKDKIVRVLTSVNDVTDAVLLEERLDNEREQNDLQTEMIIAILNADKSLLDHFIQSTQNGINVMNLTLKNPGTQHSDLMSKINTLYREVHSIKGEASALKLHVFVDMASSFEEKLKELKGQSNISGNDFLPLTILLEELVKVTQAISQLMERIKALGASEDKGSHGEQRMTQYFTDFAASVAERNGKQVRHDRGKNPQGHVDMKFIQIGQSVELLVEDDGNGIDFEQIRQKVIDSNVYDRETAEKMDKRQLAAMLFHSGVSTARSINEDAGHGVGMDVIKNRVSELNGKIRMASNEGQFTRFVITVPL
ncbi:MAG: ATP-binding protein [Neisseria sp.]|nr:ATP-binding protein [Neisseria sp.]